MLTAISRLRPTPGETLVISAIGYATVSRTISSATETISITLEEQTSQLNDVVVTALGIKRDPRSLVTPIRKSPATMS